MSETSDKLIPISQRQPVQRRRRKRPVSKTGQRKVINQQPVSSPRETATLARLNNHSSPTPISSGGRRPASRIMMPPGVKPVKKNTQISPPENVRLKTVRMEKPRIERRGSRKTRLKPMARTMLYALRLLIVGVGVGAIVGTLLSVLDPANRIGSIAPVSQTTSQKAPQTPNINFSLSQEITPLKNSLQTLATANSDLMPGVFLLDLDNGNYVDINSSTSFAAASTIKIPILIAFFQDVDAGKIRLDEMLTLQKEMIVGGSGNMQYQASGSKYTALDVATKMITISDNTATNMLVAKLGGQEALNGRFRGWGLTTTMIRNPLPDLEGTNTTSPRELGNLISMVNQGNIVSMRSRDLMLNIMSRTERDNLLPAGLGKGANAYHKTGDIGTMLADAGLVDVPTGKRYIAAIMVKRPNNDPRAAKLISSISSAAYQHFSQATVTPSSPTNNQPVTQPTNQPVTPPISNYQPPVQPLIQQPIQQPIMNPAVPNGMVNTMPIGSYPQPVMTPQLTPQYYPQQ